MEIMSIIEEKYLDKKMRVALVQMTNKHTEIFGVFIEYLLYRNIEFKIYYNLEKDKYSFLPYYEKIFGVKFDIVPTEYLLNEYFDWYIFTSSQEDNRYPERFKHNFNHKSIFIHHLWKHQKNYMINSFKVSPVIDLEVPYILPVYLKYFKIHGNYKNNKLALVGAIRNNMADKDLNLLKELFERDDDFEVYVFMRKWDWVGAKRRYKFLENERIKCFSGLETEKMIEKLSEVKMIIPLCKYGGWFHKERLTGALPLALNLNIPLLMDKRFAKIYGIEGCGLCYEKSMLEVFDKFLSLEKNDYYKYVSNIAKFRKEQFKKNKEELDRFLNVKVRCLF